jgi:uncharacterized protein with PIN domain
MPPRPAHIVAIFAIGLLIFAAWLNLRESSAPDFTRCPLCNEKITVKL